MEFFRRNDVPFALDQVKVLEREIWDEVKIDFLRRGNISLSLLRSSVFRRVSKTSYPTNNYSFSFAVDEFKLNLKKCGMIVSQACLIVAVKEEDLVIG